MAEEAILDKISNLSDLELAALLCLTNQEHCIIDTDPDDVQDLVQELRLVRPHLIRANFIFNILRRLPLTSLVSPTA